jgi:ribosomal protein S18 acetylase RimI-like enzyme
MEELNNLIRLEEKHIKPAAKVLLRAFHYEPLKIYLFPNEKIRDEMAVCYFEFMLRYVILFGEAYATSPNLEGAALWLPSEYAKMTPELMAKAGVEELMAKTGSEFMARIKPLNDVIDNKHAQNAPFRHWYLAFIGVDPGFQGKGFFGKLIKPMFSRFKRENIPCYLETESERNLEIYTHYGFKLLEKYFVLDTGLYFYSLLKEP